MQQPLSVGVACEASSCCRRVTHDLGQECSFTDKVNNIDKVMFDLFSSGLFVYKV